VVQTKAWSATFYKNGTCNTDIYWYDKSLVQLVVPFTLEFSKLISILLSTKSDYRVQRKAIFGLALWESYNDV